FVSDYVRGDVARSNSAFAALVTPKAPVVKVVETRSGEGLVRQRPAAGKAHLAACLNLDVRTLAGSHPLALPYRDQRGVAVRVNVKAIVSRLEQREGGVRRVNLEDLIVREARNLNVERSLVQLELHHVIGEVGQRDAGLASHANRGAANMQLCAGIFVSPQTIGRRDRTVDRGGRPVVYSARLHRDIAAHVVQ